MFDAALEFLCNVSCGRQVLELCRLFDLNVRFTTFLLSVLYAGYYTTSLPDRGGGGRFGR
jgi:hypothetical protein